MMFRTLVTARILLAALLAAVAASASIRADSAVTRAATAASLRGSEATRGAVEADGDQFGTECGGEGQFACFLGTCNSDDLVNRDGICRRVLPCGGEGQ